MKDGTGRRRYPGVPGRRPRALPIAHALASQAVGTERLRVRVPWSVPELVRSTLALAWHGGAPRPAAIVSLLLVVCAAAVAAMVQWARGGWDAVDALALAVIVVPPLLVVFLGMPASAFWHTWPVLRHASVAGHWEVRLGDGGFALLAAASAAGTPWQRVERVVETDGFFLFFVDRAALALPRPALTPGDTRVLRALLWAKLGERFILRHGQAA